MQRSEAKVAIVGAGPAGIAAAIQCKREGLDAVYLIDKEEPGGLIRFANKVENLPGFDGSDGQKIVNKLEEKIRFWDLETIRVEVEKLCKNKDDFHIITDKNTLTSKFLVLASGTSPKCLGIDGEIKHPPWRDYSGEKVVIIGGGDAAYDYALRIERFGGNVTILRRGGSCAIDILQKEVKKRDICEVVGELKEWSHSDTRYSLITGEQLLECDTVVTAIGRYPNWVETDFDIGEIKFPNGQNDVPRFYAVGSLVLNGFRQLSLCWGMGIAAGMTISREEKNSKREDDI